MAIQKTKWWGYMHEDGSMHVKRYFDVKDITEAHESPFVYAVAGPWECDSKNEALEKLIETLQQSYLTNL